VFTRTGTTLAEPAGAAGLRWTIEECFQGAKEELGLDHCEARSWHGWHRHMTLCMAAAAFLAGLQASLRRAPHSLNRTERVRLSPPDGPAPRLAQRAGDPRPHRQAVVTIALARRSSSHGLAGDNVTSPVPPRPITMRINPPVVLV
jgi:hypothetical protein